jgi:hypothetical protein
VGSSQAKPLLARTSASHGAVTKAQGGGTSLIRGGGGFGWRAFSSARRSIMSTLTTQLKSDIDKLWTEFWTGGITNPLTVIEQISFLMSARLLDVIEQISFLMFARLLDVMETTGERSVRIPSAGEANAGCRAVSDCIPQLDTLRDAMKDLLDLPPRTR